MGESMSELKFPDEILESIAGIIAETRSGSEITRFFSSAGYPEFIHDNSTKKWFVFKCLKNLNDRPEGYDHIIKIVEKLADPKQYINKPEMHKKVLDSLNKALIFYGLELKDNHVIASKKPIPKTLNVEPRVTETIELFTKLKLHPKIREVSESLFVDGHYSQAIFEAFKAVNNAVKEKSGMEKEDGQSLMAHVFDENRPILALNPLKSQSDKDEQIGFKFLFMGAMTGIRNPNAHEIVNQSDSYRTLYYLALANLLMVRVDESILINKSGEHGKSG